MADHIAKLPGNSQKQWKFVDFYYSERNNINLTKQFVFDGPAGIRAPGTSGLGHPTERRPAGIHSPWIGFLRIICMDGMYMNHIIMK